MSPKSIKPLKWFLISSGDAVVNNLPAEAGDAGDVGSIPGSGRFPGDGNGNPLQYSYQGNPMDRGTWRATVHGIANSWIQLSEHTHKKHTVVEIYCHRWRTLCCNTDGEDLCWSGNHSARYINCIQKYLWMTISVVDSQDWREPKEFPLHLVDWVTFTFKHVLKIQCLF